MDADDGDADAEGGADCGDGDATARSGSADVDAGDAVIAEGETVTYERTFTERDVRDFAEVSRDRGDHHLEPDEEGRLLVHGLLTATLPTKIGGDLNVLARTMTFEFRRPVYAGETVRCDVTFATVEPAGDRLEVEADVECTRDGEVVLRGGFDGVVRR